MASIESTDAKYLVLWSKSYELYKLLASMKEQAIGDVTRNWKKLLEEFKPKGWVPVTSDSADTPFADFPT